MEEQYTSIIDNSDITIEQISTILQQCRLEHDLEIGNMLSSLFSRIIHYSHKAPLPQHHPA